MNQATCHRSNTSRRVLKALGIFGSVQVVTIFCSIIRNKCVALWLGTAGIGIFALYNYTLDLISQLNQLNIRNSGVRDIAAASCDERGRMFAVVRRVSSFLAIIGAGLTLLLSPLLSYWTFGDYGHTWGFAVLAVAVGLGTLTAGEQAILQASDKLKLLARASAIGAVVGTAVSIMLFRCFGINGIVPSILIFSLMIAACSVYFSRRDVKAPIVSTSTALSLGRPMLRLGLYMTVAMALTSLASYIFIAWLRKESGEQGVGLYQAGYLIVSQYVGLIFVALGVEYFPRMASVARSSWRTSVFMRHELMILMFLLAPSVVVFINAAPLIVKILYSSEFAGTIPYLSIAAVGTVFKATSFVMAFVILARGDGRLYLVTELISSIFFLVLSIGGYKLAGLEGVAMGYVIWYALYTLNVWIVNRYIYHHHGLGRSISFSLVVVAIAAIQSAICVNDFYIPAIALSVIVTIPSIAILYRRVWNRNTVKE